MQVKVKRMLLFLFGCIGTRCLLAYIAKKINPEYLPYMGYIALIISLSFNDAYSVLPTWFCLNK